MQKTKALLVIAASYIAAILCGMFVYRFFENNVLLAVFLFDIAATAVVWAFGLAFKNSSFYDPYWSVMPPVLLFYVMLKNNLWAFSNVLLLLALTVWCIRLTVNWINTLHSLKTQDWRYVMYKQNYPKFWHLINFFGIHLFPTLIVFAGLLSAFLTVLHNPAFSPFMLIGAAVILSGTLLEHLADTAMHDFLKKDKKSGMVLDDGVWRYSRHPNYLGEIMIWLGVYLFAEAALTSSWILFAGVIAMTLMFLFISIPLMEKRQLSKRPAYADYIKRTSKLLLLPPKTEETEEAEETQNI